MYFRIGLVIFEVRGSSDVVCDNLRWVCWVRVSVICQCFTVLLLYFGVSAWHLKCTESMGPNSDVVQLRICVRTSGRWAEEIR